MFGSLDPVDARALIDAGRVTVVDIRDPESHAEGSLPGALRLDDASVDQFLATADRQRPLLVYCYHGISSQGACAFFCEQGFAEVYNLAGGYEAWATD